MYRVSQGKDPADEGKAERGTLAVEGAKGSRDIGKQGVSTRSCGEIKSPESRTPGRRLLPCPRSSLSYPCLQPRLFSQVPWPWGTFSCWCSPTYISPFVNQIHMHHRPYSGPNTAISKDTAIERHRQNLLSVEKSETVNAAPCKPFFSHIGHTVSWISHVSLKQIYAPSLTWGSRIDYRASPFYASLSTQHVQHFPINNAP